MTQQKLRPEAEPMRGKGMPIPAINKMPLVETNRTERKEEGWNRVESGGMEPVLEQYNAQVRNTKAAQELVRSLGNAPALSKWLRLGIELSNLTFGVEEDGKEGSERTAPIYTLITNREAGIASCQKEGWPLSYADQAGKQNMAFTNEATGDIYINGELLLQIMEQDYDQGALNAVLTALHESMHFHFPTSAIKMNAPDPQGIGEGLAEFAAVQILRKFTGEDVHGSLRPAYENECKFFETLSQIVGSNTITDALFTRKIGKLEREFNEACQGMLLGTDRVTFEFLTGLTDTRGEWDAELATKYAEGVMTTLTERGVEPKPLEPLEVKNVDSVAKSRDKIQGDTLARIARLAKHIYGPDVYMSPDAGLICRMEGRVVPLDHLSNSSLYPLGKEGLLEYTENQESGLQTIMFINQESIEALLKAARRTYPDPDMGGREEILPTGEDMGGQPTDVRKNPSAPSEARGERGAWKGRTFSDLTRHMATYVPTTEAEMTPVPGEKHSQYHLALTAMLADDLAAMQKIYPTPSRLSEIDQAVRETSDRYVKRHETRPDMWELNLEALRLNHSLISSCPLRPLETQSEFKRFHRHLEINAYNWTPADLDRTFEMRDEREAAEIVIRYMGEAQKKVERPQTWADLAVRHAMLLLEGINVPEPTCREVGTVALALAERASQESRRDWPAGAAFEKAAQGFVDAFYARFDFGFDKGPQGEWIARHDDEISVDRSSEDYARRGMRT